MPDAASLPDFVSTHLTGGVFAIPSSDLDAGGARSLIETWMTDQTLRIQGASLLTPLSVGGTIGPLKGISGTASVVAEFTLAGAQVQLRLTISPAASWKPSQSFPKFLQANSDELILPGEAFIFDAVEWSGTELILISQDDSDGLKAGLNLRAALSPNGILADVGQLFSASDAIQVSGQINLTADGLPEMRLTAAGTAPVELGHLRVTFELSLVSEVVDGALKASFHIRATLSPDRSNLGSLTLEASFTRLGGILVFQAEFNAPGQFSVTDLQSLFNGADLLSSLPPNFDPASSLQLANLTVVADSGARRIISISTALTSSRTWRIFDALALKDVALRFTVDNPSDPVNRAIACHVAGVIALGANGQLQVGASAPNFEIFASLAQGDTIHVTDAFNTLLPSTVPIPASLPVLVVTELDVSSFPLLRSLSFAAKATGGGPQGWQILQTPSIAIPQLQLNFEVTRPGGATLVVGQVGGIASIGGAQFQVFADFGPELILEGQYLKPLSGTPQTIADILKSLGLPDAVTSTFGTKTTIGQFEFTASPRLGTFHLQADVEDVWSMTVGGSQLAIKSLAVDLNHAPQRPLDIKVSGSLQVDAPDPTQPPALGPFTITAERITTNPQGWKINGEVPNLNLAGIVSLPLVTARTGSVTLPDSLQGLGFSSLAFGVDTSVSGFSFEGHLAPWTIHFDTAGSITVTAGLSIDSKRAETRAPKGKTAREFTAAVAGTVSFDGFSDSEFFQHFSMSAAYRMESGSRTLDFQLLLGDLLLEARYDSGKTIAFEIGSTGGSGLTFGKLLTNIVRLVDPTQDELDLDEPWDTLLTALDKIPLPDLTFTLDLEETSTRHRSFSVDLQFSNAIDLVFVSFQSVGITYTKTGTGANQRTHVLVELKDTNGVVKQSVDPLEPEAPTGAGQQVPGFDVQYLALGQHITLTGLDKLTDIQSVMAALRQGVTPLPPADRSHNPLDSNINNLVFSADSSWLIAAQFSAAKMLDMSFIFNDPAVYGVRIALSGKKVKKLAGLQFEILYRRITETIGVYHTELILPDVIRQLEFGAVSVTLPTIVLDVYTNGDFKIDAGFPWGGNFDRSCSVQVLPFTGAGGFYFNKLSAATATSVPATTTGNFSPVIEFGIGVRIGLGKRFDKGVLQAELSVQLQGILEGVIAWFNPAIGSRTGQYYLIQGSVTIIGRVYGAVDFDVIKVSVEVVARVTVQFRIEAYQPIVVILEAEVSVRASLTVLFITVHFSFSLSVSQRFELAALESGSPPWAAAIAGAGTRDDLRTRFANVEAVAHRLGPPTWEAVQLWSTPIDIPLKFHLSFTRDRAGAKAVALLFIENSIPVDAIGHSGHAAAAATTDTSFDFLAQALLAWALGCRQPADGVSPAGAQGIDTFVVAPGDLQSLYATLIQPQPNFGTNVVAFLKRNFAFHIGAATADLSGTPFPLFPDLLVEPVPAPSDGPAAGRQAAALGLCAEYFLLLTRSVVQNAVDIEDTLGVERSLKRIVAANLTVAQLLRKGQPVIAESADPVALSANSALTPLQWQTIIQQQPKTSTTQFDTFSNLADRLQNLLRTPGGPEPAFSSGDLAMAIADSHILTDGAELLTGDSPTPAGAVVVAGQSLRDIFISLLTPSTAVLVDNTLARLIQANLNTAGLIERDRPILVDSADPVVLGATGNLSPEDWSKIIRANPRSSATRDDTFADLLAHLNTALTAAPGSSAVAEIEELAAAIGENPGLLKAGATIANILPAIPVAAGKTLREAITAAKLPNPGFPLLELLFRLNKGGELNHLAGMASRFLLHGVRSVSTTGTRPLYEATGQQFALPASRAQLAAFQLRLSDTGAAPAAGEGGVRFDPAGASDVQVSAAGALNYLSESILDADFPAVPSVGRLLPKVAAELDTTTGFYIEQPHSFSNTQALPWQATATQTFKVVEMSQSLRTFLGAHRSGVPLDLSFEPDPPGGPPDRITDFAWATKVEVQVRRVAASGSGLLDDTYQMVGAGENDRQLLAAAAGTSPPFSGTVHLLYRAGDKPLVAVGQGILVRTVTGGAGASSATLSESASFLALIIESSNAPEGYYFRYLPLAGDTAKGLPEGLFQDGLSATLVLLLTAGNLAAAAVPGNAFAIHNCIVIRESTEGRAGPVIATSNETVTVFAGKAGHTGFRLVRPDDSLEVVALHAGATLRVSPVTTAAAVTLHSAGLSFAVTDRSDDGLWLHVASQISADTGWVLATGTDTLSEFQGTLKASAILRATADSQAEAVPVPAAGDVFTITSRSADGTFLQVRDGSTPPTQGFVAVGDFTRSAPSHELRNLYQVLHCEIVPAPATPILAIPPGSPGADAAGANWSYDAAGMPVGPADHDPIVAAEQGRWLYERAIPAYRLFPANSTESNAPPSGLNPYRGVEEGSTLKLRFSWSDIYGNQASGLSSDVADLDFPVLYFDPLLSLNEWPFLNMAYSFTGGTAAKKASLKLEFTLNTEPLLSGSADPKKALDQYRLVFYQLHGASVQAIAATSVAGLPAGAGDVKSKLLDFALGAHNYLQHLVDNLTAPVALPLPDAPTATIELELAAPIQHPATFVFGVSTNITITRTKADLVNLVLAGKVPQIRTVTTPIPPKVPFHANGTNQESPLQALSDFAAGFQTAFPQLRLAATGSDPRNTSVAAINLWGVQLGTEGLRLTFPEISEEPPAFFAPAPLSTTLISGTADVDVYTTATGFTGAPVTKRFDAVDLNLLGRQLLAGVEQLLSPEIAIRTLKSGAAAVQTAVEASLQSILASKQLLAEAICADVTSVLSPPAGTVVPPATAAADVFRPLLQVNLVEGYDIELAALIPAEVTIAEGKSFTFGVPPLLRLHPVVAGIEETGSKHTLDTPDFDFSVSPAVTSLQEGSGSIAVLVDTKTPENCADRTLLIDYHAAAVQAELPGQGPTWLTFVPVPDAPAEASRKLPLPVPLRTYPLAPSLISQAAEADPQSVQILADVREWDFVFTYEHVDAGQDTIEGGVSFNHDPAAVSTAAGATGTSVADLFAALLNFSGVFPDALRDLRSAVGQAGQEAAASDLLTQLATRVAAAATAWRNRSNRGLAETAVVAGHAFEISELPTVIHNGNEVKTIDTVTLQGTPPVVRLPDFPAGVVTTGTGGKETIVFTRAALGLPEPAIPSRTVRIPALDIVNLQNASAAIFLTRNQNLIDTWRGNTEFSVFNGFSVAPSFRFQTPVIRFANRLSPLLENNHPWDVAALLTAGNATQGRKLKDHIHRMLTEVLPPAVSQPFDIRVACSYAFTLAGTPGADLVTTHPILLGPQFSLKNTAEAAAFVQTLSANLAQGILDWQTENLPETRNGMYIFTISFFSGPASEAAAGHTPSPLLKIDNLRLRLTDVEGNT